MPIIKSIKATRNPDWVMVQVEPVTNPDGSKRLFKPLAFPAELLVGIDAGDNVEFDEL